MSILDLINDDTVVEDGTSKMKLAGSAPDPLPLSRKGEQYRGMENEDEGVINVFKENVSQSSMNLASSIAGTFGDTATQEMLQARVESNRDFDRKEFLGDGVKGMLDYTAASLGQALPYAGAVVGSAATATLTGGSSLAATTTAFTTSFISMQGGNKRLLREMRPDASLGEADVMATFLTIGQSALEIAGGAEVLLGKKLGNMTANNLMKKLTVRAEKEGLLSGLGKVLLSSKNPVAAATIGGIEEMGEESGQALMEIATGVIWGKQTYTEDELYDQLIVQPMMALAPGGLMGGTLHIANSVGKQATSMPEATPKTAEQFFTDEKTLEINEEELAKDNQAFDALEAELTEQRGAVGSAAASQIKSLAYMFAHTARKAGQQDAKPADFIEQFKTAFVDKSLSNDDIAMLEDIRKDQSLTREEQGAKTLEYLNNRFGENSELYQSIKGVGDIVEANEIAASSMEIMSQLKRFAPQLDETRASKWRDFVGETINQEQGVFEDGLPNALTWSEVTKLFSKEDVLRMFVENPEVKIGADTYVVAVDQTGVSFKNNMEYRGEFNDVVEAYAQELAIARGEAVATGGDVVLANEKLFHGMLEQKLDAQTIASQYDASVQEGIDAQIKLEQAQEFELAITKQQEADAEAEIEIKAREEMGRIEAERQEAGLEFTDTDRMEISDRVDAEVRAEIAYQNRESNKQTPEQIEAAGRVESRLDAKSRAEQKNKATIRGRMEAEHTGVEFDGSSPIVQALLDNEVAQVTAEELEASPKAETTAQLEKKIDDAKKQIANLQVKKGRRVKETAKQKIAELEQVIAESEKQINENKLQRNKLKRQRQTANKKPRTGKVSRSVVAKPEDNNVQKTEKETTAEGTTNDAEGVQNLEGEPNARTEDVQTPKRESRAQSKAKSEFARLASTSDPALVAFRAEHKILFPDKSDPVYAELMGESRTDPGVVKRTNFRKKGMKWDDLLQEAHEMIPHIITADDLGNPNSLSKIFDFRIPTMRQAELRNKEEMKQEVAEDMQMDIAAGFEPDAQLKAEFPDVYETVMASVQNPENLKNQEPISAELAKEYIDELEAYEAGLLDGTIEAPVDWTPNDAYLSESEEQYEMFGKGAVGDLYELRSEVVKGKETFAEKQARLAKEVEAENNQGTLFEGTTATVAVEPNTKVVVNGMYIASQRTALFFQSATAATIVHEFSHHARSLLPLNAQKDLLEMFESGTTEWSVEADEWFAMNMTKWIVDKELPYNGNEKSKHAWELAKKLIHSAYKGFDLSEETKAQFDEYFDGANTEEIFGAVEAMESMVAQDPPSMQQADGLATERSGSRYDERTDTIPEEPLYYEMSTAEVIAPKNYYGDKGAKKLAHQVKNGDPAAIKQMASEMANSVPAGSVLVPMPSRTGDATITKQLAEEIATLTGGKVLDVLKGSERESLYENKKQDGEGVDLGFKTTGKIPDNAVLIDNVYDTGTTADAAKDATGIKTIVTHSKVSSKEQTQAIADYKDAYRMVLESDQDIQLDIEHFELSKLQATKAELEVEAEEDITVDDEDMLPDGELDWGDYGEAGVVEQVIYAYQAYLGFKGGKKYLTGFVDAEGTIGNMKSFLDPVGKYGLSDADVLAIAKDEYENQQALYNRRKITAESGIRYEAQSNDPKSNAVLTDEERKKMNNHLHGILGTHEKVQELARELFGSYYTSLTKLTDDDLVMLLNAAGIHNTVNDSQIEAKARQDSDDLYDVTSKSTKQANDYRPLEADSKMIRYFKLAMQWMKDKGVIGMYTVSSIESLTSFMDNMSSTGVWDNLINKPLKAARQKTAMIAGGFQEFVVESSGKRGHPNMEAYQNEKMFLNGEQYTKGEVASMAIISRMTLRDSESFVMSNYPDNHAKGRELLIEANTFATHDKAMKDFIDIQQEVYQHIHPLLDKALFEATGKHLGKVENYLPFLRMNDSADLDQQLSMLNGLTTKERQAYKDELSRAKSRKGGAGSKLNIATPYGSMTRYINAASNYIGKAMTVKQALATLNSQKTIDAIKWKYGEGNGGMMNYKRVHSYMVKSIQGELFIDGRITPMNESENIIRKARSQFTFFALAAAVGVSIKQAVSLPIGIARSGRPLEVAARAGVEAIMLAPKAFVNASHNAYMYATQKGTKEGYRHVLDGTAVYQNWQKFSPMLADRHGNPETGEAHLRQNKGFAGITWGGRELGEVMMSGITTIDALTVGTLWQSSFDAWTRVNKENGMSESEAMIDAAEKANRMISSTQPASVIHERSLLFRENEWVKSAFMFTGATSLNYETFVVDIAGRTKKAVDALIEKDMKTFSELMLKGNGDLQSGLLVTAGVGFILPAMMFGMLSRRRPQKDEDELLVDILSYPVAMLPFSRALIGASVGVSDPFSGGSTYYLSVAEELTDGVKGMFKQIHGRELDSRSLSDTADALALMAGAPRVVTGLLNDAMQHNMGMLDFSEEWKRKNVDPKK